MATNFISHSAGGGYSENAIGYRGANQNSQWGKGQWAGIGMGIVGDVGSSYAPKNGISEDPNLAANTLSSIPTPVTQIIGGAMKIGDMAGKALAGEVDENGKPKNESNYIAGSSLSGLANPTSAFSKAQELDSSGWLKNNEKGNLGLNALGTLTGTQGFFNAKKLIKVADRKTQLSDIKEKNQKALEKAYQRTAESNNYYNLNKQSSQQIYGKPRKTNIGYGKEGGEIKTYNIDNKQYYTVGENIKGLQSGGSVNLIPDGAYHHTENNLGGKGLSVVTEDGIKHFEIEAEELIINSESSIEMKELYSLYNKTKDKKYLKQIGEITKKEVLKNTKSKASVYDCLNTGTCKLKN